MSDDYVMKRRSLKRDGSFETAHSSPRTVSALLLAIRRSPDDHWLLTRLASTYYELRRYDKALEYSSQALTIKPNCPLARWDHACALDQLGRHQEAVTLWQSLISQGARRLANGDCGEGTTWSRSLVNDCRYRVGKALHKLGRDKEALKYYRAYIRWRKTSKSIFAIKAVRSELHEIQKLVNH